MKNKNCILIIMVVYVLILDACTSAVAITNTQIPEPTATILPTSTPGLEKNISKGKPLLASHYLNSNPPSMATDLTHATWWSSGDFAPQWIEIDLGSLYNISKISLTVSQSPSEKTVHRVLGQGVDGQYKVLHVFDQYTYDGQILTFSPDSPWQDISRIKVETVSSPSWVGWREIMVFSKEPSRAIPPKPILPTPTPLVAATPKAALLYPGWESFSDGNMISDMAFDRQGNLWAVGSGGAVLWHMDGSYTRYAKEHGLMSNQVNSVAVAPDDTVWFGTIDGVVSFDGKNWVRYSTDDGLLDNHINTISVSPDGAVVFGTMNGISLYKNDTWSNIPLSTAVYSSFSASDNSFWFGGKGFVLQFEGTQGKVFTEKDGLAEGTVWAINETPDGDIWFGTSGEVSRFDGRNWTTYTVKDGIASEGVYSIAVTPDKKIWFGTFKGGATVYDGDSWTTFSPPSGLMGSMVKKILMGSDGAVWFGTWDGGVFRYDEKNWTRYLTAGGLANNYVYTMREMPDGVIWFGTNNGITRLSHDGSTTYYSEIKGIPLGPVSEVYSTTDGVLWVAAKGGAFRLVGDEWTAFTSRNGLVDDFVLSVVSAQNGDVWVGTNMGISRLSNRSSLWSGYRESDGKTLQAVTAIVAMPDNSIWARSYAHKAIMRFDGSTWKPVEELGKSVGIPSMVLAADGSLWVAGLEAGVMRFDGKKWMTYSVEDGLPTNHILAVYAAPDGSIWFGTYSDGVVHFDGTSWTTYTTTDGLSSNYVVSILAASDGSMWFGTNNGASHYTAAQKDLGTAPTSTAVPTLQPSASPSIVFLRLRCDTTYTVQAGTPLEIHYGAWLAVDKEKAVQNAQHLSVRLVIDGEVVEGVQQPVVAGSEIPCVALEGLYGVYFSANLDSLSKGTHVVTATWIFDEQVTDGYDANGDGTPDNYGPGEIATEEYMIIVE